ncbi:MAG: hypothetical protein CME21_20800 [Gemmatimonadetes bacterium]|nr:hypothetical protein [Gemmatimonadota bacterium]
MVARYRMKYLLALCALVAVPAFSMTYSTAQEKPVTPYKAPAESTEAVSDATATTTADSTEEEKEKKTIESETKSSKRFDGLFTVFQDTTDGSLKVMIKKSQLNKEYIYFTQTVDGPTIAGHFRGNYRQTRVFSVRKHFNRIELVAENTSFYFDKDHPLRRARDANISDAILVSEKIEVDDGDAGIFLIEGGFFLTEALHQIKRSKDPNAKGPRFSLGSLSKTKTKIRDIRNYPANTDLIIDYVYDSASPVVRGGRDVTDARSVTIALRHSLIEMPKNDYKPRADDPRIGYFATQVTDLTSTEVAPYRDMIRRWHLVKKDPKARLSRPVKPITFWIENTTPNEIRKVVKKGALAWNKAFEAAGFKDAIEVKIQPDDADWDAGDIRYNVLRWTSSPNPPFGGYGPSFVNPRTGEILGADIMLEFIYVSIRLWYDRVFETAASPIMEDPLGLPDDPHICTVARGLHEETLFGLQALKVMGATKLEMNKLLEEGLQRLILHEIGHTLALSHNFRATYLHDPVTIHDKGLTSKQGLTGSVMEYPAINFAPLGKKQGHYYDFVPGPYDTWAIEYGYSAALKDPKKESKRLETILARSTEPQLAYANDADDMRSSTRGIDPRAMIYDMSSDPITYGIERIELLKNLTGKLLAKYDDEGSTYQELRQAYLILTGRQWTWGQVFSRHIGGVYVDRAVVGQPGATKPFTPVAYEDQKRAMKAIADYILAPDAFDASPDLYSHLQRQRRGFTGPGEPQIHARILNAHKSVLGHLLHKRTLIRITDSGLYGNTYGVHEMVGDLSGAVFAADIDGPVNTVRQNLQQEYLDRLVGVFEGSGFDHVAKSAVLSNLRAIQTWIKRAAAADYTTTAHRELLLFKIDRAMDPRS